MNTLTHRSQVPEQQVREAEQLHRYVTNFHQLMEEEKTLLQRYPGPGCAPSDTAGVWSMQCAPSRLTTATLIVYTPSQFTSWKIRRVYPTSVYILRLTGLYGLPWYFSIRGTTDHDIVLWQCSSADCNTWTYTFTSVLFPLPVEETDWGGAPYQGPAEPFLTNKTQISDLARAERNQAAIEELQRSAIRPTCSCTWYVHCVPSLPHPLPPSLPPL